MYINNMFKGAFALGVAVSATSLYALHRHFTPDEPANFVTVELVEPIERTQARKLMQFRSSEEIRKLKLSGDMELVRNEIVRLNNQINEIVGADIADSTKTLAARTFAVQNVACHAADKKVVADSVWGKYGGYYFEYPIHFEPSGSCEHSVVKVECKQRIAPVVREVKGGFVILANEKICQFVTHSDDRYQQAPKQIVTKEPIPGVEEAIKAHPFPASPSKFKTLNVACRTKAKNPETVNPPYWGKREYGDFVYGIFFDDTCEYLRVDIKCSGRVNPFVQKTEYGFVVLAGQESGCRFDVSNNDQFQKPPANLLKNALPNQPAPN